MTDLAASAAAQVVQQHAAATDWPCIAIVRHQCFIPSELYAQQLTLPDNTHTNSTAGSIHSTKGFEHMGAAATSVMTVQHMTSSITKPQHPYSNRAVQRQACSCQLALLMTQMPKLIRMQPRSAIWQMNAHMYQPPPEKGNAKS